MDEVGFGFSQETHLRKRREFLDVYKRGDSVRAAHFVLYVLENNLPYHRLGITASRKVGKAAVRNRIKRRVREIFRANKPVISPPCDLVVNIKRSAADVSYQEIKRDFLRAIRYWKKKNETLEE
ncbi:ribonuclease P protein component [Acidobacteria bacterium AH-259-A15]|nr:ribonuclease P protein component [Acidobacteria bacterium AH-259-A15]